MILSLPLSLSTFHISPFYCRPVPQSPGFFHPVSKSHCPCQPDPVHQPDILLLELNLLNTTQLNLGFQPLQDTLAKYIEVIKVIKYIGVIKYIEVMNM